MKPYEPVPFGYDGERVVDDFVLLTVLVGNDFIPHLPSLDIGEGALDSLLDYYRFVCAHAVVFISFTCSLHYPGSISPNWVDTLSRRAPLIFRGNPIGSLLFPRVL